MANQILRAYISSTYLDLKEYRQAAFESLKRIGVEPVGQETLGATPEPPLSVLLDLLRSSDIFIGIYAHRYGGIPQGEARSYIEIEYDTAHETGKPCFIFFVDPTYQWPANLVETGAGSSKLEQFRQAIFKEQIVATFTSVDDLSQKLAQSVSSWLARSEQPNAPNAQPEGLSSSEAFGTPKIAAQQSPTPQNVQGPVTNQPQSESAVNPAESVASSATPSAPPNIPLFGSLLDVWMWAVTIQKDGARANLGSNMLLAALLRERPSVITPFLELVGLQPAQALAMIAQRAGWTKTPSPNLVPIPPPFTGMSGYADTDWTPNVKKIYPRTNEIAQELGHAQPDSRDLVLAILDTPASFAASWLTEVLSPRMPLDWVKQTLRAATTEQDLAVDVLRRRIETLSPPDARPAYSDADASEDKLDFDIQAKALAEIILKPKTVPPVVIGVYGPWGSGKSTFLNLVQKNLQELQSQLKKTQAKDAPPLPELIPVEFNAWAYTDSAKLWAGLVQKISKHLDDQLSPWQRYRYSLTRQTPRFLAAFLVGLIPIVAALGVIIWGSLSRQIENPLLDAATAAVGFLASLGFFRQQRPLSDTVNALTNKFDPEQMTGVMNQVRDEIQNVIQNYFVESPVDLKQQVTLGKLKVVVFIDELDRCPLNRIVDILEAIKLFLAEEIFIVLIAVDTRVAAEAIRLNYKDVTNPELAREYLEKIVQIPLPVPRAKKTSIENYLTSLMDVTRRPPQGDQAAAIVPAVASPADSETSGERLAAVQGRTAPVPAQSSQPVPKSSAPPAVSWKPLELPDTEDEYNVLADVSLTFLESNPRRVKRLLNTYRYIKVLSRRVGQDTSDPDWQKRMIAWLVFTLLWPDFMAHAIRQAASPGALTADSFLVQCLNGMKDKPRSASGLELEADHIRQYLDLSPKSVLELAELASNFLIENPVEREEIQPQSQASDNINGNAQNAPLKAQA